MKFQLLLDTCVWLDLAKNPADEPIISALEELVETGKIELIVPDLVKAEFARNKERVVKSNRQRLTQEFQKVRSVMLRYGDESVRDSVIHGLDELQHKLPILTDVVAETVGRIERLFHSSLFIVETDAVKLRAAERALVKKAPFHNGKNSMADAVIIELYGEIAKNKSLGIDTTFFITHNVHDFSSHYDNREPHPDFNELFDVAASSSYSTSLASVLQGIDNEVLQESIAEYEWSTETRGLSEILEQIDELTDKIWYDRHMMRAHGVAEGRIKVVPHSENHNSSDIVDYIWEGALKAAEEVRQKYPNGHGPWTDFEWGELNGKLSALRWVIGYDWDMLDT